MRLTGLFLLALLLAGCGQTQIYTVSDAATGLAVTVEGDYIVEPWPVQAPYTAMISIKGRNGHPFVPEETTAPICIAAFQPLPDSAGRTQAEINASVPSWAPRVEAEMAGGMRFEQRDPFESKGLAGYRFVVTPLGEFSAKMRIVLYVMETPKGRTALNCSGNAETLAKALPVYDLIRDGITAP